MRQVLTLRLLFHAYLHKMDVPLLSLGFWNTLG